MDTHPLKKEFKGFYYQKKNLKAFTYTFFFFLVKAFTYTFFHIIDTKEIYTKQILEERASASPLPNI